MVLFALVALPAQAVLIGPTPYSGFAGSPFDIGLGSFALEDFEDGLLNVPGVTASSGFVLAPGFGLTDSVENSPDGCNPSGIGGAANTCAGYSYYGGATVLTFTFMGLPTHAGIVWTDVGYLLTDTPPVYTGVGGVTFEAFDQFAVSMGTIGPDVLGDGIAAPMAAEDRFFGAINPGGLTAIRITMPNSNDWEVDHLQFGTIPEPSTGLLALVGLAGAALARRARAR